MGLRICFTYDAFFTYRQGGVERWFYEIGRRLAERGHEVYHTSRYRSPGQPDEEEIDGIHVVSYGDRGGEGSPLTRRRDFWSTVRDIDADVYLNSTYTHLTGLTALASRLQGAPFIYVAANDHEVDSDWRRSELSLNRRVLGRLGMRLADRYVAYTDSMREEARHAFGGPADKYVRIYPGHEPPDVDIDEKEDIVFWIANFNRDWKRPHRFLDIAEAVDTDGWRFCLGGFGDEATEDELRERCEQLPNAEFVGRIADDWSWYRRASLLVNTSDRGKEGFPNTFMQALMAGTPVVSRHCDPDSIITDNDLGFVSDDIAGMADWIGEVLADDERLADLQRRARAFGKDQFDIERTVDRYEALFDELQAG